MWGNRNERIEAAWRFLECQTARDPDGALAAFTPDAILWSAVTNTEVAARSMRPILMWLAKNAPFTFQMDHAFVDGDTVVIEAQSWATMPDGKQYHNYYAYHATLRDGKVAYLREYLDTKLANDVIPLDQLLATLNL
jgi:ketosteroid isomerase-like protein